MSQKRLIEGNSAPGRRPGYALPPAELLERAEAYERSTRWPTRKGFLEHANIRSKQTPIGETLSQRALRIWLNGYAFPHPMVPETDPDGRDILVLLVEADRAETLRWVSRNVRLFGYEREELIGRPARASLYPRGDPSVDYPALRAAFIALRDGVLDICPPTLMTLFHRDGHPIEVEVSARYGVRSGAWYVHATLLAPAHVQPAETEEYRQLQFDARSVFPTHARAQLSLGDPASLDLPPSKTEELFNTQPYVWRRSSSIRELVGARHPQASRSRYILVRREEECRCPVCQDLRFVRRDFGTPQPCPACNS